jgi:hypothetical protein
LRTETSPFVSTVCTGLLLGRYKVQVPNASSIRNLGRGLKYLKYRNVIREKHRYLCQKMLCIMKQKETII